LPAPVAAPAPALTAAVPRQSAPAGDRGLEVLEPAAADCGSLPPHQLGPLRDARAQADALLETQSVSAATVDWWEKMADECCCRLCHTSFDVFVACRLHDFRQLYGIVSHRQPLEFQARLFRVMGQLAGQIGFALTGLGALRESLAWNHTARLAADEAGDRRLRALLTALEALTYFWEPHLAERAIAMCETAQLMAGASPTVPGTFAASLQARAYARLGRRREALDAMHRAETMFGRLVTSETDPTRSAFDEQRLWYDRQNTLTRLGEIDAAIQAREHAMRLTPSDANVDPVQIQLDEASCLIAAGEIGEGCALACRTLGDEGNDLAGGLMWLRAMEIDDMCRSRGIRVESARSLHQMVMQAARQSRPLSAGRDGWYRLPEAGNPAGSAVGPKMLN
jgi:tetratricopeptide (TPR) repeat protein